MAQSFVCIKKANGKIRLCLEPTHLNKWFIRPRHNSKLVDNILHNLNGAKYFSMVDSTSSFFIHKLDEESSKLTNVWNTIGRYRYLRMPMGASLSSDVYQYKVDNFILKTYQMYGIADDIIMYGYKSDGRTMTSKLSDKFWIKLKQWVCGSTQISANLEKCRSNSLD